VGRLSQLLCRHDYVADEHIVDRLEPGYPGSDHRLDVYMLRCTKCSKTKRVTRGESAPIDTGEEALGRRPKLPR
jgi:hypothetical protein